MRRGRGRRVLWASGAPLETLQPLGRGWGVSTAYSTLAALEAAPGRALITQYRLLLAAKPT